MTTFILLHGGQNLVFTELMNPNLRLLIQDRLHLHLVAVFFSTPLTSNYQLPISYCLQLFLWNLHVHKTNTYSYEYKIFHLSQITNCLVTLMSFITHINVYS